MVDRDKHAARQLQQRSPGMSYAAALRTVRAEVAGPPIPADALTAHERDPAPKRSPTPWFSRRSPPLPPTLPTRRTTLRPP